MGLLSFLRTVATGTGPDGTFTSKPVDDAIAARAASTYSTTLQAVYSAPVTRDFALAVPAVLRGRNVICSIATLPLVTVDRRTRDRIDSPLLSQIDPQVPNLVTLAQTFEDLIFDSVAWWRILAFGWDGYPSSAQHVAPGRVSTKEPFPGARLRALNVLPSGVDPSAVVWIDGQPVDGRTMIRFDSPNPPLLVVGKRAIRRAALLDAASSMYAEDPSPRDYFTPADGEDDPPDDEVQDILDDWVDARRRRATGYVPAGLERRDVQSPTPADLQLVQLQQRTDLALANMLGLDPEDVGVSTTSRTYNNATDRRRDKINDTLAPYMLAVTSRLSMNDVTRRAQAVMFDLRDYLKADPATQASVDAVYLDRNVVSAAEVRSGSLGLPDVPVEPRPALPAAGPATPSSSGQPAASQNSAPAPVELEEQHVSIPATFSADAPERPAASSPSIRRVSFSVDADVASFAVDAGRRTITGQAVPFGEVTSDWRSIAFAPGSVEVPAGRTVPVLMSHGGTPLGVVASTSETTAGMDATLRLSKTVAGDEALTLAADKAITGMSVGVDIHTFEVDTTTEVTTVTRATLREISLTPFPAFDSARVDSVTLSRKESPMTTVADNGTTPAAAAAPAMTPELEARFAAILDAKLAQVAPAPAPAAELPADFAAQLSAAVGSAVRDAVAAQVEVRETVNPVRDSASFEVREELPYRLDGGKGAHEFSSDLFASIRHNDGAAKQRLQTFMREAFVSKANVATINPSINRPDLFVDERSFSTPLWDAVNKGTIADSTPFILPNFTSASNVVADHTEGTEPTAGTYVTGSQTITPAPMSGKFPLVREIVDQGGNPQLSQILWAKIRRAWAEALESKVATLLNASSALSITITTAAADGALAKEFRTKLAALQFVRGGFRFNTLALQVDLYAAMIGAQDTTGRPLFPFVETNASSDNSAGTVGTAWGAIRAAGLTGLPSWALGATSVNSSNSFLFDSGDVSGWATEPRDLNLADQDVANVYIGVWGYQATAVTDVTGVRKLAYDPV